MISLRNITKRYSVGKVTMQALDGISLDIERGEHVAIVGPSGSGKSTLMNMIGCLDTPTSGSYVLNGKDVSRMGETQLASVRSRNIGFIFQRFNLLGRVSALRNVEMPAQYAGGSARERRKRAIAAMEAVGLKDKLRNKPVELSGGQQQRVAIARALINDPAVLLADEPTGSLDSKTGMEVLDLFEALHRDKGITLIVVTHDHDVAARATRVISIRDGRLESDISR
jgi:putative ABC transport system ATP-binding protein